VRPDAQDKSGNMGAEGMAEECDRTVCAPRWNAGTVGAENVAFETKRERTCLRKAAIDADSRFLRWRFRSARHDAEAVLLRWSRGV